MQRSRYGRMIGFVCAVLFLGAALLAACGSDGASSESDAPLHVTVSIVPQEYFVQRIGGERVAVTVMVPPGASPHTYEPRPEQMRALARSDAYLLIGVGFEQAWLERIRDANSSMLLVDTAEGIQRLTMEAHSHDEEEEEEEHDEDLPDPHLWLSPRLVAVQAEAIYRALTQLDPEHEGEYLANLEAFLADIDALDVEIRQSLAGITNRQFIVFHPAWGYFAAEYNLEQIPIEVGGLEPSAAAMARLITEARDRQIRVILAQPEFSTQAAETIAHEIGGRVELISPLAPDWLENMHNVAQVFATVLGK